MSTWKQNWVPDEWQSAAYAARDMFRVVRGTSYAASKHALGLFIPFVIGVTVGVWLIPHLHTSTVNQLFNGILTFVSVLSGFMVTLMLFTGPRDSATSLSPEWAREYSAKITYLLWSQTVTLGCLIFTAIITLAGIVAINVPASCIMQLSLGACILGGLLLSLFRTLLLPMQIYELHSFDLSMMVKEKESDINRRINELHQ